MAQKESEVHGRVAKVGGFVIEQGEAAFMDQDIRRTVIPVAKSLLYRKHALDDRLHLRCHLGAAFLNPAIEGIDAQLHEHRVVAKGLDQRGSTRSRFVDLTEDASGVPADF